MLLLCIFSCWNCHIDVKLGATCPQEQKHHRSKCIIFQRQLTLKGLCLIRASSFDAGGHICFKVGQLHFWGARTKTTGLFSVVFLTSSAAAAAVGSVCPYYCSFSCSWRCLISIDDSFEVKVKAVVIVEVERVGKSFCNGKKWELCPNMHICCIISHVF